MAHAESIAEIATPTAFATRPDDPSDTMYKESQSGTVHRVNTRSGQSTEILSLQDLTEANGERGLLGLAFSPNGNELYVHFTDRNGNTNVNALAVVAAATPIRYPGASGCQRAPMARAARSATSAPAS